MQNFQLGHIWAAGWT